MNALIDPLRLLSPSERTMMINRFKDRAIQLRDIAANERLLGYIDNANAYNELTTELGELWRPVFADDVRKAA